MGWSLGFDDNHKRDIGYGVPAYCDHPDCDKEIDRGLSYVCGGEPYGGENGCGLFFCPDHLTFTYAGKLCGRCIDKKPSFEPKKDHPEWIKWKLEDDSWEDWRKENPEIVKQMRASIKQYNDSTHNGCATKLNRE